jgi:FixJ family two-component response regulator
VKPNEAILVIEDDTAAAAAMRVLLEVNDFEVQTYVSAEEFIDEFDGRPIGCLVLDVRLPGISGLELQKELANRDLGIPIVMISGHADEQARLQAIKNGASAFLLKPFSGKSLCQAIRDAITASNKS